MVRPIVILLGQYVHSKYSLFEDIWYTVFQCDVYRKHISESSPCACE